MASLGTVTKSYISVLDPLLDQRDIDPRIASVYRDESFMSFLEEAGMQAPINTASNDMPGEEAKMAIYHSFYDDPLGATVDTTGATVTNSGTPTVTVTGLNAGNSGKVLVGDTLYFPDGKSGLVTTVAAATSFVVTSVDGTNLTLVAGNVVSPYSSAQPEGSDAPGAVRFGPSKISNKLQVIRTTWEITDVQKYSGVEIEVNGERKILPYEATKAFNRHRTKISAALLMGQLSATNFSDGSPALVGPNGLAVQTTRGMYEYIKSLGVTDSLTTLGTFTIDDITDYEQLLMNNRAPLRMIALGAHTPMTRLSNFIKGLPSSGAINSVRIPVNGTEVNLRVTQFETGGGFEWNLTSSGLMNNLQVLPAGTDLYKSILTMPIGQVNSIGNSAKPYMRYRFWQPEGRTGGNRTIKGAHEETVYGNLAPVPTNGTLKLAGTFTTYIGMDVTAPQHFGALKVMA